MHGQLDGGSLDTDIAIVGMAGRFPGARDVDALWELVREGRTAMVRRTPDELLAAGVSAETLADPAYVPVSGMIEDVEAFDAAFFDIGPRDAAIMDPQHRHFLECAWAALEHAGHPAGLFQGSVGVYAGCGMNGYFIRNLLSNSALVDATGMFLLRHTANDKDFLSTGVSYRLNLTGPSVNIQTACSTSLVAIHLAVQGLLAGECDMALAGGVTIEVPHGQGYTYREGEVLSKDGQCRAFDAGSSGTVLTSGVGVVALRRLRDALADGDTIHAVIKGSAINNDGSGKVGYLAPSVDGHAAVVADAQAVAQVSARSIQYIEAHGTGTAVGDPIEVAALTQAFRVGTDDAGFCRIGSTKPNIGHLDTAAGVASVIKATQALTHRTLPPLANFTAPNPLLDLDGSPFTLSSVASKWPRTDTPRRAGVSSLGVGGTNAHLILEEAPQTQESADAQPWQLLTLSAKSASALGRATENLAQHLVTHPEANLADVAATLGTGRVGFAHRRIVAAEDVADAVAALRSADPKRVFSGQPVAGEPSVAFLFPGGGSQYPNMGRDLYEHEPVYRAEVDRCLALLPSDLAATVRGLLYPEPEVASEAAQRLTMTSVQLPAIFITEWALAQLWLSRGVRPAAMTGHSLGEYTAACLAGVMSLADALTLVSLRGRLVEQISDAAMISVPLSEAEARQYETATVTLAVVNAPEMCVFSGSTANIAELEARLTAKQIECRRLNIVAAAHCSLLDPILPEFAAAVARVPLSAPTVPYVSNVTGTWVRPEDAQDPAYWVRHLRHTVRFAEGMATLLAEPNRILLEVGPGGTLGALARQQPTRPALTVSSLAKPGEPGTDRQAMLTSLGRMWIAGLPVDWQALLGGRRRRVPLPTYPFERSRHWIEPGAGATKQADGLVRSDDVAEWLYRPVWGRADLTQTPARGGSGRWLVFIDEHGVGGGIVRRLRAGGDLVMTVAAGAAFARRDADSFVIDPESRDDYVRLVRELAEDGRIPTDVVHLWSVRPGWTGVPRPEAAVIEQRYGFFSLLYLAQSLAEHAESAPIHLSVVTAGMQRVDDEAAPHPESATVLGPVRVIPREVPGMTCRAIDIALPSRRDAPWKRRPALDVDTLSRVCEELLARLPDDVVAIRHGKRWTQTYQPTPMPQPQSHAVPLREGGVYLITGGRGGIGLAVAEHLARTYRAKLALLGRTSLPDEADWDAWLAEHDDADPTSAVIHAARRIAAAGGDVLMVTGDVCDLAQMSAVREQIIAHFGAPHGIFHAAGVLDDGLLHEKTFDAAARVLAPKLVGTLVLDEVFKGDALELLVLFSSTSALLGLEGQIDYTAANAFLDAFATSRPATQGTRVLAIDWGIWKDVGLAARALNPSVSRERLAHGPNVHPLLGTASPDNRRFTATLNAREAWVLNEHRLADGTAIIPGTGYLEMARAAVSRMYPAAVVELRDVHFIAPLEVSDDAPRAVRVSLTPEAGYLSFTISSNPDGARVAGWHDHAVGEAWAVDAPTPEPVDLHALQGRCLRETMLFAEGEQRTAQERHLRFGPRWKNLRRISYGSGEALATLELQAPYRADLEAFPLHPALLDLATGFALPLLERYVDEGALFVPISYRRVRVYRPLTPRILSHAVLRGGRAGDDVVTFDVTIMDETGAVLVEVEGFAMRRVHGASTLTHGTARTEREAVVPDESAAARGGRMRLPLGYHAGITRDEGMAAMLRALAASRLPRVIVSPVPLAALMRAAAPPIADAGGDGPKVARPDLASEFAAATDPVEQSLVEMWQDLLGVDQIGTRDDFFDLGGHSLIAVRLVNRIKRHYGMDLGLAVLFDAPTIAALAGVIRGHLPADDPERSIVPTADGSRWSSLVAIQPKGSRTPLFCVHGMNGNVLKFRDLAARLGPDQPFYGLQPVGLDGISPPHRRIEEMAAHYLAAIREVQPHGPYLLTGFSGGGLIAFEMAHQLAAVGERTALLGMFDTYCPAYLMKSSAERVRNFLRGVREGGPRFVARWVSARASHLADRQQPTSGSPMYGTGLFDETITVDLGESFVEAQQVYQLRPLDVEATIFRAEVRYEPGYVPRDMGWTPFVAGVSVIDIPGDHESIWCEPNVSAFAARLRRMLDRACSAVTPEATPLTRAQT